MHQSQPTDTGASYGETELDPDSESENLGSQDNPPSDRKPRGKRISKSDMMRETIALYYRMAGMAVERIDTYDGQLIAAKAPDFASAWMVAGKADPRIQRVLEAVTIAGPYTALIFLHAQLAFAIMDHHGASPMNLFQRVQQPNVEAQRVPVEQNTTPSPFPYQPVGPNAPTDNQPLPYPTYADNVGISPDEKLPPEIDLALQEAERKTGRPYQELKQEFLVAVAQEQMRQNMRVGSPGTLGAPVVQE